MSSPAKALMVHAARRAGLFFLARRVKLSLYGLIPTKLRDDAGWIGFYSEFVSPGDLVFDVGANVGIKTKTFLGLGAKVVCVEPLPAALEELTGVFGANEAVTIVPMALASQKGEADLFACDDESGLSSMSSTWISKGRFSKVKQWEGPTTVQTTTLDELGERFGVPAFCKIDVEGYEYEVLGGLTSAFPSLSFEFHGELKDVAVACVERLEGLSSYRYSISWGSPELWDKGWVTAEELIQSLKSASVELEGEIYARSL